MPGPSRSALFEMTAEWNRPLDFRVMRRVFMRRGRSLMALGPSVLECAGSFVPSRRFLRPPGPYFRRIEPASNWAE